MTRTPRPAPRATPLLGSLAVHAVLIAVAAAIPTSIVAAGAAADADDGPTVLAWVAHPESRQDDVVVRPPSERPAQVPAARRELAELAVVLPEDPLLPPRLEVRPAPQPAIEPPSSRPVPGAALSLHPGRGGARRGHGAGAGGAIGVGTGGSGDGNGTGSGNGSGAGTGEGDDGDGQGVAARGGPTRGPEITASLAAPPYPRGARSRGWEGRVVLVLGVAADGHVTSVDVAETSGHDDLDDAARTAAQRWTFAPALKDGEPVAGSLRVPVRFELTD